MEEYINVTSIQQINSNNNNNNNNNTVYPQLSVMDILEKYTSNRNIDGHWYIILIIMYSVLIVVGAVGNILVVIAVVRKPVMRTARNLFILNLAISDLLLCLITMPLTLVEILTKYWPFGNVTFLCKLMGALQATSIFVSTISITAIALDRYQVIVYPTHDSLQTIGAISILFTIWLLAIILASPLFIVRELVHEQLPNFLKPYGLSGSVCYCFEGWQLEHGRALYSGFSFSFQYLLPILLVSSAYFRIYHKLKHRIPVGGAAVNFKSDRRLERGKRMKRTNCLLISISIIFGFSWLPLNIFNLYMDIWPTPMTHNIYIIYALCHMCGMSSACSNPLLYGWLNENFRKEFQDLLCACKKNSSVNEFNNKNGTNRVRRQTLQTEVTNTDNRLLDEDFKTKHSECVDHANSTELTELVS